jgi:hypothetical protein
VLLDARRCNLRDGVTGALVCRQDIYLQFLEGPAASVEAAFARIGRDDRHLEVTVRVSRRASDRMFAEWAMLHDPARSWIWSASEVAGGAIERATPDEFERVFIGLAEQARAVRPA